MESLRNAYARFFLTLLLCSESASSYAEQKCGDLTCRFVMSDEVPLIPTEKKTEEYGAAARNLKVEVVDESLIVAKDRGIKNILVFAVGSDILIHPNYKRDDKVNVTLNIQLSRFEPHVLPLWTSRQLLISNRSTAPQNIKLSINGETKLNPAIPVDGEIYYKFEKGEALPLLAGNDFAPWMSVYILPLSHPYATTSQPDGTFQIKNLPLGEMEFQVWHEKAHELNFAKWSTKRFTVDIKPGQNDIGTISIRKGN